MYVFHEEMLYEIMYVQRTYMSRMIQFLLYFATSEKEFYFQKSFLHKKIFNALKNE